MLVAFPDGSHATVPDSTLLRVATLQNLVSDSVADGHVFDVSFPQGKLEAGLGCATIHSQSPSEAWTSLDVRTVLEYVKVCTSCLLYAQESESVFCTRSHVSTFLRLCNSAWRVGMKPSY